MSVEAPQEVVMTWKEYFRVTIGAQSNEKCVCYLMSYKWLDLRPSLNTSEDGIHNEVLIKPDSYIWTMV